jgi:hypothetical protein
MYAPGALLTHGNEVWREKSQVMVQVLTDKLSPGVLAYPIINKDFTTVRLDILFRSTIAL